MQKMMVACPEVLTGDSGDIMDDGMHDGSPRQPLHQTTGRDRCPERSAAQRVAHGLAPETSGGRENRVGWLRLSGFQRFSQVKTM